MARLADVWPEWPPTRIEEGDFVPVTGQWHTYCVLNRCLGRALSHTLGAKMDDLQDKETGADG
jgi:hypothetical protein